MGIPQTGSLAITKKPQTKMPVVGFIHLQVFVCAEM
jgi:hypothetical protein